MLLAIYGITILVRLEKDDNDFIWFSTLIQFDDCTPTRTLQYQGIFLGIYGGYIVEANEEALKKRQKKLNDKIIADAKGDTEAADAAVEAQKEPSIFEEVYSAVAWQIPIIVLVFVVGLIIGHLEGWGVIER